MNRQPIGHVLRSFVLVLALAACSRAEGRGAGQVAAPGATIEREVPGFPDRGFDLELPASWDGRSPLPLIVAFHGGGGHRASAETVSCPDGKRDDPRCLGAVARAAGFAVAYPDGTGARLFKRLRTWNAGGGVGGWNCASGPACADNVDDMAYFDALLGEIGRVVPIDPKRIHLTGLSNGGAIAHRLACERSARVASIVAVGGSNQLAAAGGACAGGVPVLEIHGTEDPCWTFEESDRACLARDGGKKVGTMASMEGWRVRNGCDAAHDDEPMPDRDPNDGTTATRLRWRNCKAAVELIRIDGGGHTWPSGQPYLSERRVGRVSRDFGSEVIVDFFRAHPRP